MTISHNGHGRSYAICDSCDENVIDLPLDIEACSRILKTFFRWSQLPDRKHHCSACAKSAKRSPRRTSIHRGMKWKQEEKSHAV